MKGAFYAILTFLIAKSVNSQNNVRLVLQSEDGPKPIGPYSGGLLVGNTIYVSGFAGNTG